MPAPLVFIAASRVNVAVFMSTAPPTLTTPSNSVSATIAMMLPMVSESTSTVAAAVLNSTSPAVSTTSPARVKPPLTPTLSSMIMLPVPAVSVSVRVLPVSSNTSSRVMLPSFVVSPTFALNVAAEVLIVIAEAATVVWMPAPSVMAPVPSNSTVPAEVICAFTPASPLLVTVTPPELVVMVPFTSSVLPAMKVRLLFWVRIPVVMAPLVALPIITSVAVIKSSSASVMLSVPAAWTPIVVAPVSGRSVTVEPAAVTVLLKVIESAVRTIGLPLLVAVLLKSKVSVARLIPPAPVVATAPVNVVVPVPVVCVMVAASNAKSAVTFNALAIVTSLRLGAPTTPSKSMLPAPAVSPNV